MELYALDTDRIAYYAFNTVEMLDEYQMESYCGF